MGGSHFGSPGFGFPTADLDGGPAVAADQMVVVFGLGAAAVHRLTGVGADGVEQVGRGQRLQGAVDGGQSDVVAAPAEFVVQFLGGAEPVDVAEQVDDRCTLAG